MAWTSHITWQLERLVGEEYVYTDITVEYGYSPGRPAVRYLSNGDPGYPAESSEVELHRVYDSEGNNIELTEEEEENILGYIDEHAETEYAADYADYLYDLRRDEMMEEKWNDE